jgi:hypothetical protein
MIAIRKFHMNFSSEIFHQTLKKSLNCSFVESFRENNARLEIISDVVSEKTNVVSVFPMWYRNFSATCLSDTTSEIISNRVKKKVDLQKNSKRREIKI